MIGLKSVAAVVLAGGLIALAAARGVLGASYLASLSGAACFAVGLFAAAALGLVGVGWRFAVPSKAALAVRGGRLTVVEVTRSRDVPSAMQRGLLLIGLACLALVALGNHAAARIGRLPADLGSPSPSAYCVPEAAAPTLASIPVVSTAAPVEQAGCALVKRAYQLGYAKTLGACAPKQAAVAAPVAAAHHDVCTRRQLDEPFLHYGYRRLAGAAAGTAPVASAERRVDEFRAHLDHLDGLIADVRHAITGTRHASHHVWINLPDPHPGSWREVFTGEPRCATRFADLPLWPRWQPGDEGRLVEHVLGQLLFATRFGTTASCNDYTIHWDAPADACAQIARDPVAFLDRDRALATIRGVLDRRRRQLELSALDDQLGRPRPAPPPAASAVVSLQCLIIDRAGRGVASGTTIALDGDRLGVRELRVPAVVPTADGPIDVYLAVAAMFAGADTGSELHAPEAAAALLGDAFPLTALEPLADADPFAGARWPLQRPELVEIFPFERHLHPFIEAFRRRYLAQRGRL